MHSQHNLCAKHDAPTREQARIGGSRRVQASLHAAVQPACPTCSRSMQHRLIGSWVLLTFHHCKVQLICGKTSTMRCPNLGPKPSRLLAPAQWRCC